MKIRSGFVSNSSSSSFIVLKNALSNNQIDMILHYQYYVESLLNSDIDENDRDNFEYYSSDPWQILENEDYIFGETSMDNFDMQHYLDYIKVEPDMIYWDDGYTNKPWNEQLNFIRKMKQLYRKNKINNINKNNEL